MMNGDFPKHVESNPAITVIFTGAIATLRPIVDANQDTDFDRRIHSELMRLVRTIERRREEAKTKNEND